MAAPAILHDLIEAGVEFETDGEHIRWRNAGGRVTPEVVETLRRHKAEIIGLLSQLVRKEMSATVQAVLGGSIATKAAEERKDENPDRDDQPIRESFPHGRSIAGHPLTWTGRIVSLDEWQRLSAWEKDGPNGLVWSGITKKWENPKGNLRGP